MAQELWRAQQAKTNVIQQNALCALENPDSRKTASNGQVSKQFRETDFLEQDTAGVLFAGSLVLGEI